ncbi:hypothetical protein [Rhizobium etli]|uniref:Uncharacterized protein n=1 Tax=Rhizobium etli TaxID=29449 RepID=A0A7W6ZK10_RHIET|nr:hypothetical protein [Rhizobium etli]MBB4481343.1 hypothetical protein [Rhizobium etli]MBB4537044.1 hypothetical protein [Rhizobium etli]
MTIEEERNSSSATARTGARSDSASARTAGSLYWEGDFNPDLCVVAAGAFAEPKFPPPSVSVFEQSEHEWLQLADEIKHAQRGLTLPTRTIMNRMPVSPPPHLGSSFEARSAATGSIAEDLIVRFEADHL